MSHVLAPLPASSARRPLLLSPWKRWILIVTMPTVGVVVMFVALQRSLIYQPFVEKALPAKLAALPTGRAHDVTTRTEDGLELRGWLILAKGHVAGTDQEIETKPAEGRPVVLYFGGNAANRSYRTSEVTMLANAGADVLIFDYRGYGDSPGEPTEEGLRRDARAAWRFATVTKKIEPRRIVLFGESLGGGVAISLASELSQKKTPPAGLILRSTFSSLADAGAYHFPWLPVRWLLIDRFPSEQRIRDVTCPLMQFHGRRDTIIPLRLGRKLFAAAPEMSLSGVAKQFVELPNADHNDVMETSEADISKAVRKFLPVVVPR